VEKSQIHSIHDAFAYFLSFTSDQFQSTDSMLYNLLELCSSEPNLSNKEQGFRHIDYLMAINLLKLADLALINLCNVSQSKSFKLRAALEM